MEHYSRHERRLARREAREAVPQLGMQARRRYVRKNWRRIAQIREEAKAVGADQ